MFLITVYRCLGFMMLLLGLNACYSLEKPKNNLARARPPQKELRRPTPNLNFSLPATVTLCGEPLALNRRSIYERLESEFLQIVNHPAQITLWQRRAIEFFPLIESELRRAGLPDDLKYLAVTESDLRPWVVSPAGARGLWQFIPATARHFGLTVDERTDQRYLPELLSGAAVAYLKKLHTDFSDSWALALSAYNAGEGHIDQAIAKQETRDYYQLDLPKETERYVYRIVAIKLVLENATRYGLKASQSVAYYRPVKYTVQTIQLKNTNTWPQLAKRLGYNYKTLRTLNPHILQAALTGSYEIRVPTEP